MRAKPPHRRVFMQQRPGGARRPVRDPDTGKQELGAGDRRPPVSGTGTAQPHAAHSVQELPVPGGQLDHAPAGRGKSRAPRRRAVPARRLHRDESPDPQSRPRRRPQLQHNPRATITPDRSTPRCRVFQPRLPRPPCFTAAHSPSPTIESPVLSTRRCRPAPAGARRSERSRCWPRRERVV